MNKIIIHLLKGFKILAILSFFIFPCAKTHFFDQELTVTGQIDRYVALSLIYSHLIGVKPNYLTTCKNYTTKGNNFTIVPHILQQNNVLTIQQDTFSIKFRGDGGL